MQRRQLQALADEQAADALGAVELVGAEGEEIDRHPADVHRHLADGLHGVGMEEHAVLAADLRQFAGLGKISPVSLLAHMTETRAVRSGSMCAAQRLAVDDAVAVDRQVGDLGAQALQKGAGVAHAGVLHLGGQDLVFGTVADQVEIDALEHVVVAFAGAAVDDDVVLVAGADAGVKPVHGQAHVGVDLGAEAVQRVGIAVLLAEERLHRFLDPRVDDGRGVIVQVYSVHCALHYAAPL